MTIDTLAALGLTALAALYLARRVGRYFGRRGCACGAENGCPAAGPGRDGPARKAPGSHVSG